MGASRVQNIVGGSTVAALGMLPGVEDELLGMPLEMAVALRELACLGPQFQAQTSEEHCEGHCWGCPQEHCGNTVGASLVGFGLVGLGLVNFGLVSLLGSVALVGLVGDITGDFWIDDKNRRRCPAGVSCVVAGDFQVCRTLPD